MIENIVFVEDEREDFLVFSDCFQKINPSLKVYQISSPQSADKVLSGLNPSETLVFVDLNIDGFDGLEFFGEYLRPKYFLSVVLSSSDNPIDIQRCYGEGLAGYFSKQNSVKDYIKLLESIYNYHSYSKWNDKRYIERKSINQAGVDSQYQKLKEEKVELDSKMELVMSTVNYPGPGNSISTRVSKPDEFFSNLLSNYSMGIYVFDFELNSNIYINSRYTELTGYTIDDLMRFSSEGSFLDLFHPEDLDSVLNYLNNTVKQLKSGEFSQIIYRFKNRKGSWIKLLSEDTPFEYRDDGSIKQTIGNFLLLKD